jgi:hypothetical protein
MEETFRTSIRNQRLNKYAVKFNFEFKLGSSYFPFYYTDNSERNNSLELILLEKSFYYPFDFFGSIERGYVLSS